MTTDYCDNCGCSIGNLERREMFNNAIVCTDCYRQLMAQQRKASAGPLPYATPASDTRPVLSVELTAKRWKAQQAAGVAVLVLGVLLFILAAAVQSRQPSSVGWGCTVAGCIAGLAGLTWYAWARVMAWWHHG